MKIAMASPDDGVPGELVPRHQVRTTEHLTPADVPSDKWRAFGKTLLEFHYRMGLTAMCRCGETVISCYVLSQARAYGLLPPLP